MKTEEIKRTSDKKGISLIVLVITIIVIIILAVAVILSIANNNPIENAKEARFKSDIKTIEEDLNMYTLKKYADGKIKGIEEVNLSEDDMVSALPSTKNYKDKVEVKNGTLYVKSGELTKKEQKWVKDLGVAEEKTYKIGDEVSYKGEEFYVIGGNEVGTISASTQNILLLSKYNLTSDGKSQDTSGASNECVFSSTNYWSSVSGIAYPDADGKYPDLNDVEKYPIGSETSVITKAQEYGNKIFGVPGKLLTYEEACKLDTQDYSDILYGTYAKDGCLKYWLGSADDEYGVHIIQSRLGSDLYSNNDSFSGSGVRPVITVSKSLIK